MDSNNNKIKNWMQGDDHQPLPPELDWSKMKDGIFDKMQSIEQAESSSDNRQRSWKRIGLFLFLFFTLSFGLYSLLHKSKTDQHPEAYDVVQLPEADTCESESSITTNSALANQPERSGNDLQENGEDLLDKNSQQKGDHLLLAYENSGLNQDSKKSQGTQLEVDQGLANQNLGANYPQNNLLTTDLIGTTHSALDTGQKAYSPSTETRLGNRMLYPGLQPISPYGFDQVGLGKTNLSLLDLQNIDSVSRPATHRFRFPDQLIVEGGINYWNEGYGNSKPDRAQYEAPIPSFQVQGSYMKGLKGSYFVMAGLQYQQLESKLDYRNTIEDYKITLIDTVLQVQNNLLTGKQTIIRGDVEELVNAERRVIHYNKTQLFKASLALGKRWRFNSFQTDVYLGGALNSVVRNQGRMFLENEIIDYQGASNSAFQNQWTLDGVLGVRFHYLLTPVIGITTGFQTQKSLMNWSNQEGINFYPASFGLQMGLSYSLR